MAEKEGAVVLLLLLPKIQLRKQLLAHPLTNPVLNREHHQLKTPLHNDPQNHLSP